MKVLVTGAAGFMGSWIADVLHKEGHDVYGTDSLIGGSTTNLQNACGFSDWGKTSNKWKFFNTDLALGARTVLSHMLDTIHPEIVYHLSASAREGASQFQPFYNTRANYYAYMGLLEECIKTKSFKKMILFSSMSIYGKQTPPFVETMCRAPEDIYAINKAAMEHSTEILADVHGFDYTIIRPHNVFGTRQSLRDKYRNVLAVWMNCIMRGEQPWIFGDGRQQRAFSYIEDSLPCYVACLNKANSEIVNIGGVQPVTINYAWHIVKEAMGANDIEPLYLPDRPREVKNAYCTYKKSQELLGYQENVGFVDGVKRMAEWAKGIGPQEWTTEKLALINEKTPEVWR